MLTPLQRFKEVKDVLRGMGLNGLVDQIDVALQDLETNYDKVIAGQTGEIVRLRAVVREALKGAGDVY